MNSNNHNDFLPSVTTSQDSVKGAIHEIDENEERPECALPRTNDDDDEKKKKDDDDNDNDGKKKNKAKRNSSKMLNRFSTSGVALADKFTLLMNIAEDAVQGSAHFVLGKADKPRRYVFDRCDGKSDYRDHWKPPCAMFYVPMPVKWFPDLLEQNPIMEYVGKLGCVRPYDYLSRKIIFSVATLCQLVAFGMTFVAAMAISKDYDILQATSFTHGQAALFANDTSVRPGMIFDMGLLGVAVEQESRADGNTERVLRWDDFCDEFSEGFEKYWDYDACNECGQQSKTLVGSMLMSLLFSIPTFTTDILRFYPDYDVSGVALVEGLFVVDWTDQRSSVSKLQYRPGQLPKILWLLCGFHFHDFESRYLVWVQQKLHQLVLFPRNSRRRHVESSRRRLSRHLYHKL